MAGSIFLKIPDVEGESTHTGYEKWFHLSSFTLGAQHPHSVRTGTQGPSSGHTTFSDAQFTMANQKTSNTILDKLCRSTVFETGVEVVFLVDSGSDTFIEHVKYKFDEVMLTGWMVSGQEGMDGGGIPSESWSFGFAKIAAESQVQTKGGAVGSGASMEYDIRKAGGGG